MYTKRRPWTSTSRMGKSFLMVSTAKDILSLLPFRGRGSGAVLTHTSSRACSSTADRAHGHQEWVLYRFSDHLLDFDEMPLQQPVGNKWQAAHLFVGVLEVIGLHDGKHTWTVTNSSVETLNDPLRFELGCDPHLLFEVRANLVEICKGACRMQIHE